MKAITRFAVPAALALAAFGASAQTIETDYPVVGGAAGAAVQAPAQTASTAAPFLIQSNAEGARIAPAYEQASKLSRDDVQKGASVSVPRIAGHNA